MFELFKSKPEEKPMTESEIMSARERTDIEAARRAEEKHPFQEATQAEVDAELMSEALEEDKDRPMAA